MRFIEENFNNYKIPETHQGNHFQLSYMEQLNYQVTRQSSGECTTTMNPKFEQITVKLDNRMETATYQDNPYDKAIDVESMLKHNLKAEWDFKFTRELLKKVYSIAKTKHMYKQYRGFKKRFYNLVGYEHLMWAGDLDFHEELYSSIKDYWRHNQRQWMIVPIEILNDFKGSRDFRVIQSEERGTDISYEGVWRDIDVYTFPAGPSDQIVLGMKPQQETDQVISIAMKEPYYQYQEREAPMGMEKMIGYNVPSVIFEIPGAEDNYISFKYTMFRSNFWKWAINKIWQRSIIFKIVNNFKKKVSPDFLMSFIFLIFTYNKLK